jgi:hypothetical protein
LVVEGGDHDPGERFAVPAAGGDVVGNGFAVRADEVAFATLARASGREVSYLDGDCSGPRVVPFPVPKRRPL